MHSGTFTQAPPALECSGASYRNCDIWGVFKPRTIRVGTQEVEDALYEFKYGNIKVRLYRHPELFICSSIRMWFNYYSHSKRFKIPVDYETAPAKYVGAMDIYELYLDRFIERLRKLNSGK